MSAQDFNLDQSLATKFQALLGATRQRQHRQPAPALGRNAPTRVYTAEQLQTMSLVELRNVLHSLGSSNLGSLPKWQLIAYALQKQDEVQQQQQQQHMLFTESELKSMAFSELDSRCLRLSTFRSSPTYFSYPVEFERESNCYTFFLSSSHVAYGYI